MTCRMFGAAGVCFVVTLGGALAHAQPLSCTIVGGSVVLYSPTANHSCGTAAVHVNLNIFKTETVSTGTGSLTFHTPFLYRCREYASSSDKVSPASGVAIQHLTGTTWCRHLATDPKTFLTANGQKIFTSGTIVGLVTDEKGATTVKLADGSATVTLTSGRTVAVPQGTQLVISRAGAAGKPAPIVITPTDQVVVAELRFDVAEGAPAQSGEFLRAFKQRAALILAPDAATGKRVALRLKTKTAVLTFDQVQANPKVVADELQQLGAKTIVTTGPSSTVQSIWEILRTKVDLPPNTALLYSGA